MRKWFVISLFAILSIGFTIGMDLLLGVNQNAPVLTILSPFRFMRGGEIVMIVITLLYVIVLELVYTARKKR